MTRILTFVLIAVLITGLIIGWLLYKNRKNEEIILLTQQDLLDTQEEVKELSQQLEVAKSQSAANNMQMLYERILKVMEEKELYLNADLDIKMLAEAANSSRAVVSSCINNKTGKPFRIWLAEYRLSLFENLLKLHPDAQIVDLSTRCGYKDQSTFRRQFKDRYGMTALQYKKNINDEK